MTDSTELFKDDPAYVGGTVEIHSAQAVNQPTGHVTDKVTAATVGSAIIALVVAVLTRYGFEVDAVTATAISPLAVLAAGWLMKERR